MRFATWILSLMHRWFGRQIRTACPGRWNASATWEGGRAPRPWDDVLIDHPVEIRGGAVMARDVSVAVPNAVGVQQRAGMFYIYGALIANS